MVQELSAGAVIFRNDNGRRLYLLLHYERAGEAPKAKEKRAHWDFVKGHVENDETIEQTVCREAQEETGLKDLTFANGFEEKIHYFFKRGRTTVSKDVVFLLAETKNANVTLSFEHAGFVWLPYADALAQTTFETARSVLRKAEEFLNVVK
ncbi:MAG: NUDIX domain-containing protein [Candidatus Aenigmarchaeota archaeon]|nr:NUDIX domain-containing protein [Candidatus Aenigmarchaeota archaeon]